MVPWKHKKKTCLKWCGVEKVEKYSNATHVSVLVSSKKIKKNEKIVKTMFIFMRKKNLTLLEVQFKGLTLM